MRALIIGHDGQDGGILWKQLAARDFSLLGVSRRGIRVHASEWNDVVDITDFLDVERLVAGFNPDQIYYLAAHHHSSQDSGSAEGDAWHGSWNVHVHAFSNILRAAKDHCPDVRIFYASSSRVFGEAFESPQDETTLIAPSCVYGVTKASAMLLADYYVRVHGLFVSCGILFNHESPVRGSQFVSQRIVNGLVAIKYGLANALEIGSLDARVDWGYAPDYTRAMQLILECDQAGIFVVASGQTHSVREMIAVAAEYLQLSTEVRVMETASILRRRSQDLCGNPFLLRSVTGWQPVIGFHQMVRILVDAAVARHHGHAPSFPT
ncbi:GDP-mannose 4,6-dehydratase [Rhodanobacter umsongensis]|uniref:GDP-mannose 4,6-dehydratase n=1 Tax=Rhodanobacter umsongensis TaxID=633153 RepID=A0ABW0JQU4_9GAMM